MKKKENDMVSENNSPVPAPAGVAGATEIDHGMIENMKDEDLKILAHMLMDVRDNERREMEYAKKQSRTALIISVICLCLVMIAVGVVITIVPKAINLIDNLNNITAEAEVTLADASVILDNLNTVTDELAKQDIAGLFEDVSALIGQSQTSITEAMDKVNQMDIETLNSAIKDLQTVVEPLARLFGR